MSVFPRTPSSARQKASFIFDSRSDCFVFFLFSHCVLILFYQTVLKSRSTSTDNISAKHISHISLFLSHICVTDWVSRDTHSLQCQQKQQRFHYDFLLWYFKVRVTLLLVFHSVLLLTMMCLPFYFSAPSPDLTPTLCLVTKPKWLWLERSARVGASHFWIKVPLSFFFFQFFFFASRCPQGNRPSLISAAKQTFDCVDVISLLHKVHRPVMSKWSEHSSQLTGATGLCIVWFKRVTLTVDFFLL